MGDFFYGTLEWWISINMNNNLGWKEDIGGILFLRLRVIAFGLREINKNMNSIISGL